MLWKKLFSLQRFFRLPPKFPFMGSRGIIISILLVLILFVCLYVTSRSAVRVLRTEGEEKAIFEAWVINYGKSYNTIREKEMRFQIFRESIKDQPSTPKLNVYSDLTYEEKKVIFPTGLIKHEVKTTRFHSNLGVRVLRTEDEEKAIFEAWVVNYGKTYNTIREKEKRFQIFRESIKDKPGTPKLNIYSDLNYEELKVLFPTGMTQISIQD